MSVAILSTSLVDGDIADFNAVDADPASLRLGTGGAVNPLETLYLDVDSDSDTDLLVAFSPLAAGIACDDTSVNLVGTTFGGSAITATASITTVDCDGGCHP